MQLCWKTQPDDRPTFKSLVTDIEEYLTDMMNYFNPLESDNRRPSDPYITWQLISIAEEGDSDEDSIEQHKEQTNSETQPVMRRDISHSKSNTSQSKQSVSSNRGATFVQSFGSFARMVSSQMKRRTTSKETKRKVVIETV